MLLNGGSLDGTRLLEPQTIDLMAENHIEDVPFGSLPSLVPELSNDVGSFFGSSDRFGLGFLLNGEPVAGGRAKGSLAWAGIYNTYFWIDRDQGIAGVLLAQILPFYDARVRELLAEFERSVYALTRTPEPDP